MHADLNDPPPLIMCEVWSQKAVSTIADQLTSLWLVGMEGIEPCSSISNSVSVLCKIEKSI